MNLKTIIFLLMSLLLGSISNAQTTTLDAASILDFNAGNAFPYSLGTSIAVSPDNFLTAIAYEDINTGIITVKWFDSANNIFQTYTTSGFRPDISYGGSSDNFYLTYLKHPGGSVTTVRLVKFSLQSNTLQYAIELDQLVSFNPGTFSVSHPRIDVNNYDQGIMVFDKNHQTDGTHMYLCKFDGTFSNPSNNFDLSYLGTTASSVVPTIYENAQLGDVGIQENGVIGVVYNDAPISSGSGPVNSLNGNDLQISLYNENDFIAGIPTVSYSLGGYDAGTSFDYWSSPRISMPRRQYSTLIPNKITNFVVTYVKAENLNNLLVYKNIESLFFQDNGAQNPLQPAITVINPEFSGINCPEQNYPSTTFSDDKVLIAWAQKTLCNNIILANSSTQTGTTDIIVGEYDFYGNRLGNLKEVNFMQDDFAEYNYSIDAANNGSYSDAIIYVTEEGATNPDQIFLKQRNSVTSTFFVLNDDISQFNNYSLTQAQSSNLVSITNEEKNDTHYRLFDLNGKIIGNYNRHNADHTTKFDFSNLVSGIYLIQCSSEKYNETLKVVIQ